MKSGTENYPAQSKDWLYLWCMGDVERSNWYIIIDIWLGVNNNWTPRLVRAMVNGKGSDYWIGKLTWQEQKKQQVVDCKQKEQQVFDDKYSWLASERTTSIRSLQRQVQFGAYFLNIGVQCARAPLFLFSLVNFTSFKETCAHGASCLLGEASEPKSMSLVRARSCALYQQHYVAMYIDSSYIASL